MPQVMLLDQGDAISRTCHQPKWEISHYDQFQYQDFRDSVGQLSPCVSFSPFGPHSAPNEKDRKEKHTQKTGYIYILNDNTAH